MYLTWTRLSGKLIFSATSSRMKMSGYRVFVNKFSKMSSWARVNVVRSRRCFRVGIPKIELVEKEKKWETICQRLFRNLGDLLRGAKIFIILFVATFPLWATTLHYERSGNKLRSDFGRYTLIGLYRVDKELTIHGGANWLKPIWLAIAATETVHIVSRVWI